MLCHECINEDKKSKIYPGGGSITCMGYQTYYDEDGTYHLHDPNWSTTAFSCSNGHSWTERKQSACPAEGCDYGKE